MTVPNTQTLTLFDLLARQWQGAAPVVHACFTADGMAAFATEGGAVLIAGPDEESPERRIRVTGDLGQTTIRPRARPASPLIALSGLAEGAPPLVAAGAGFLAGDADGRVLRIGMDGVAEPVLDLGGAVVALDHAGGTTAAADADSLVVSGPGGVRREGYPGFRCLALTADGRRLAGANAAQVVVIDERGDEAVPIRGALRLTWAGDGRWLAAALGSDGLALIDATDLDEAEREPVHLRNFPSPVRSLDWSAPAGAVVAAGAFRVAAWAAGPLPSTEGALVTGQPGLVVVETVAAHPARPLVAAGYANGQVTIAQIGSRDELLLRQGGAAVTCLSFSPDGRHLAIGDAAGTAAVASFPSQMFK